MLEINTRINVPVIEFVAALLLFATCMVAQFLAMHSTRGLHFLSEPQAVTSVPDHPSLHVTVTVAPISPVIEPAAALLLFATCVVAQRFPTRAHVLVDFVQ